MSIIGDGEVKIRAKQFDRLMNFDINTSLKRTEVRMDKLRKSIKYLNHHQSGNQTEGKLTAAAVAWKKEYSTYKGVKKVVTFDCDPSSPSP